MPFEMSNSHGDEYSDDDKINEIVETRVPGFLLKTNLPAHSIY